jgi:hypothetical protein
VIFGQPQQHDLQRLLIGGFSEAAFDRLDFGKRDITGFDQCIDAAQ